MIGGSSGGKFSTHLHFTDEKSNAKTPTSSKDHHEDDRRNKRRREETNLSDGSDDGSSESRVSVHHFQTQIAKTIDIVKELTKAQIRRLDSDLTLVGNAVGNNGQPVQHLAYFTPEVLRMMPLLIDGFYDENPDIFDNRKIEPGKFREWSWDDLCYILKLFLPEDSGNSGANTIQEQLDKLELNFRPDQSMAHVYKFMSEVVEVVENFKGHSTNPNEKNLSKVIIRNILKVTDAQKVLVQRVNDNNAEPPDVNSTLKTISKEAKAIQKTYSDGLLIGMTLVSSDLTPRPNKVTCKGCGVAHQDPENCLLKTHPDFNSSDKPWSQSVKGLAWAAKGQYRLPLDKTLNGKGWDIPADIKEKFKRMKK